MVEPGNSPSPQQQHQSAVPILIGLIAGLVLGLIANQFQGPDRSFAKLDRNGDGQLTADEIPADSADYFRDALRTQDKNSDGSLAKDEYLEPFSPIKTLVAIAQPVGKIFLRLMFMVVVPLVFAALSLAVVKIGDVRHLGRLGLKTLAFTGVFSVTAVLIGIGLVNGFQPGKVLSEQQRSQLVERYKGEAAKHAAKAKEAKSLGDTLVDMIPENPLQEMVGAIDGTSKGNGMLAVMCCALIVGLAITSQPATCQTLVAWLEGVEAVAMTVIGFALKLAPVGAGCLVFAMTAQLGFDILKTLLWFTITVVLGLALQLFGTYSVMIGAFARIPPWRFFRDVSQAMLTAFGTSSSNATLPTAMRVAETELKLPEHVSDFVLTVGATGNQNGTALYEGVVILFLAQVMGVELTVAQQFQVVLMSVLAGIGTAGVPGGSLPLIMVVMQSVGVPPESIGIILGIDRLLDMCRTVVNVTGDLAVATCVSRGEETQG